MLVLNAQITFARTGPKCLAPENANTHALAPAHANIAHTNLISGLAGA